MAKILKNSIITPDGTELVSRHRHDYVMHTEANGNYYAVDGGNDYLKRGFTVNDFQETSVTNEDSHCDIREDVEWGKLVDGEYEWIKIKDLSSEHIEAIIRGGYAKGAMRGVIESEMLWRGR